MMLWFLGFLAIAGGIVPYICILVVLTLIAKLLGLKPEADWECNQPKKEELS